MPQATSPFAFRSILCAIDFSGSSAVALRYAAAFARARKARLSVVFAVDPLLSAAAAYDNRSTSRAAKKELDQFVRGTLGPSAGGAVRAFVGIGKPAPTVLAIADSIGADLVVAGTHGLTGIRKLLVGSTTEAILRRSTLPVLVVPPSPEQLTARGVRRLPHVLVLTLPRSGRFSRLVQGSDAYHFVHDARCPVLVMRLQPVMDRTVTLSARRPLKRRAPSKRPLRSVA